MSLHHVCLESQVLAVQNAQEPEFVLDLSRDDLAHAKVLRLKRGEHICVVDASSDYFECEIISFEKNLRVRIAQKLHAPSALANVWLVQGLPKAAKFDDILRHGTEIGLSGFIPFQSERSVVKINKEKCGAKMLRWQAIVKSAAMQSGRVDLPEVASVCDLDSLCIKLQDFDVVVVCWEECGCADFDDSAGFDNSVDDGSSSSELKKGATMASALHVRLAEANLLASDAKVCVVVGPEGGFSASEIASISSANKNYELVSLGPTILRCETAALVASSLCLYELGALQ